MKFILLFIITISLFCTNIQAQTPGFQGKKFFIEADFSFFPTLKGPTVHGKGLSRNKADGSFAFNTQFGGSLNYIVSRDLILQLDYSHFETGSSLLLLGKYVDTSYINTDTSNFTVNTHTKIQSNMVGITAQFYNKIMAPLGGYTRIGLYYGSSHFSIMSTDSFDFPSHTVITKPVELPYTNRTFWSPQIGFGFRNVIAKRLTWHWETNFMLSPRLIGDMLARRGTVDYELKSSTAVRLQDFLLINFKVGIGVLLF